MTGCPDCPDLTAENMPPGWTPRAKCCRDEHVERRLAGDPAPWEGVEAARARSDKIEKDATESRQVRRRRERGKS